MGTSLLSTTEKAQLDAIMDDVHATFAGPITVWKDASQVVIVTDPHYNPLYKTGGQTTSIINTPISRTFNARIQHNSDITKEYWNDTSRNAEIKIPAPVGTVRLKIAAEDYEWIRDAKRFDVDGNRFILHSSFKGHGLFDNKYYTIYLKPDL